MAKPYEPSLKEQTAELNHLILSTIQRGRDEQYLVSFFDICSGKDHSYALQYYSDIYIYKLMHKMELKGTIRFFTTPIIDGEFVEMGSWKELANQSYQGKSSVMARSLLDCRGERFRTIHQTDTVSSETTGSCALKEAS